MIIMVEPFMHKNELLKHHSQLEMNLMIEDLYSLYIER